MAKSSINTNRSSFNGLRNRFTRYLTLGTQPTNRTPVPFLQATNNLRFYWCLQVATSLSPVVNTLNYISTPFRKTDHLQKSVEGWSMEKGNRDPVFFSTYTFFRNVYCSLEKHLIKSLPLPPFSRLA
jgi:hypothetical protein